MTTYTSRKRLRLRLVLLILAVGLASKKNTGVVLAQEQAGGMQATWTPSDADDGGPLPLSQNQRNQLSRLEQVIRQAPDPQATLEQVASQNQMDPAELVSLLQRNRHDLEQAGALTSTPGSSGSWLSPRTLITRFGGSILLTAWQLARQRPRLVSALFTLVLMATYVTIMAPRTGLHVSRQRSIFSSGPTTIFRPPTSHLKHHILSWADIEPRFPLAVPLWDKLGEADDLINGMHVFSRKDLPKDVKQAVIARKRVEMNLPSSTSLNNTHKDEDEAAAVQLLRDLYREQARNILANRQLSEWSSDDMRFVSSSTSNGMLVVRGLGDWSRYGLAPVQVSDELDDDSENGMHVLLCTRKGSAFDGMLRISVFFDANDDDAVIVQVALVVPRVYGRTLSRPLAQHVVTALSSSVVRSLQARTQQSHTRRFQSQAWQEGMQSKATERRSSRAEKTRQLEAMAADRRRRWQRQNPNAGSYRPSGRRMQSPNNAVY